MNKVVQGHRVLFTGDCDTHFYQAKWNHWKPKRKDGPHSIEAVYHFIKLLADSGVDTYLVNPNGQRAYYPSKTTPWHIEGYKRGDRGFIYGHILGQPMTHEQSEKYLERMTRFLDRYLDLVEAGKDWLAEVSKACRKYKVSPWLTIRMNDMHGANSFEGSFMNSPLLKEERFRLKGAPLNQKEGFSHYMQALNFEKKEVRNYMMGLIREVIEDYDYEGIELDWTRTCYCCNPVASQKTIDVITDWHNEIREVTMKKAKKSSKPYVLGLRIPAAFDFLRNVGIDAREMARRKIIDYVAPTAGWQNLWDVPIERWKRELGGDVAVFGVIEDAPNWVPGYNPKTKKSEMIRYLSASAPMIRGAAANKLTTGADAVDTFNFFCTDDWEDAGCDYPALKNMGDINYLRGKPKYYAFATGPAVWSLPFFEAPEQLPVVLEPQCQRGFRLGMCAEPADKKLKLTIQVVVDKKENMPDIGVSFNSSWPNFICKQTQKMLFPVGNLTEHIPEYCAFNYEFRVSAIREGWNDIVLANGSQKRETKQSIIDNSVKVASIELAVK